MYLSIYNKDKKVVVLIISVDPLFWFTEVAFYHLDRITKYGVWFEEMHSLKKAFSKPCALILSSRWSHASTNNLPIKTQPTLCQGDICKYYLVFLNHSVLVILGGWLPGDYNCSSIPIIFRYWNTLRWSTGRCLFGEKDWMVKFVKCNSERF